MPFVLSKTVFADALPMRILPALVCAAIVYPSVGLEGIVDIDAPPGTGPAKAAMFVASLCLTNLVGSAMFSCIGILCASTAVAVLVGVLYVLFTLLFSGFLANANHMPSALAWLPYLSSLRYNFELVMSNELLGKVVTVATMYPGDPHAGEHKPVTGEMIVTDYLGFNRGLSELCTRTIPIGDGLRHQTSACWLDLYIPALWFVGATLASCALLRFCVKDPH